MNVQPWVENIIFIYFFLYYYILRNKWNKYNVHIIMLSIIYFSKNTMIEEIEKKNQENALPLCRKGSWYCFGGKWIEGNWMAGMESDNDTTYEYTTSPPKQCLITHSRDFHGYSYIGTLAAINVQLGLSFLHTFFFIFIIKN